jgi:hypothetical protein
MPPLRSSFAEQKATGGSRFPAPEKTAEFFNALVVGVKNYDMPGRMN